MVHGEIANQKGHKMAPVVHRFPPRSPAFLVISLALAMTLLFVALTTSLATANEPKGACEFKPYVVKIHADWCGTCRMVEATWERIRNELADRATVVMFDVSDRVALKESQAEAERLGISEFFEAFRSRTGTIAVLDCKTHRPVAVLIGERDFAKYDEAVDVASR